MLSGTRVDRGHGEIIQSAVVLKLEKFTKLVGGFGDEQRTGTDGDKQLDMELQLSERQLCRAAGAGRGSDY